MRYTRGSFLPLLLLGPILASGCVGSKTTTCGDELCPKGYQCDELHDLCVLPSQRSACDNLADGDVCQVVDMDPGVCDLGVCLPSFCGDGHVDATEECDLGETYNSDVVPDVCRKDCRAPWCGDGVTDSGEACDDGNANSDTTPDACRTDCTLAGCGDGILDTGEVCDDGNAVGWDGCTACALSEFLVGAGASPQVGMADDGSFVVVWLTSGASGGLQGQAFDASGARIGGGFVVDDTAGASLRAPALAMAPDGTWVVAWQRSDTTTGPFHTLVRQYTGGGTAAGAETTVLENADYSQVDVALHTDGSFVVVWSINEQGTDYFNVKLQRYSAAGAPVGSVVDVNAYTTGGQIEPVVTVQSDGTAAVIWEDEDRDGTDSGVYGRRISANGTPAGDDFQVHTRTGYWENGACVAALSGGGFVVLWLCGDADLSGTCGQRFSASGTPEGGEFPVNEFTTLNQGGCAVAGIGSGGFIATWHSQSQDQSERAVLIRGYTASGSPVAGEVLINLDTTGDQYEPDIAAAADGRHVVVWTGNDGVYAQRFDAQGTRLGGGP